MDFFLTMYYNVIKGVKVLKSAGNCAVGQEGNNLSGFRYRY